MNVRLSVFGAIMLCGVIVPLGLAGCGGDPGAVGSLGDDSLDESDFDTATGDAPAATFGKNLVKNSGFEMDAGGNGYTLVPPSYWVPSSPIGCATVIRYDAGGGFPIATSPGPPSRGLNFVGGGQGCSVSELFQRIKVSWAASTIDAGEAQCVVSAFLGGFASQRDRVVISIKFRNASLGEIGNKTLPSVSPADRSDTTGLLKRIWRGRLPKGTRFIDLNPKFERFDGSYNDGYLDAVSVKLTDLTP